MKWKYEIQIEIDGDNKKYLESIIKKIDHDIYCTLHNQEMYDNQTIGSTTTILNKRNGKL